MKKIVSTIVSVLAIACCASSYAFNSTQVMAQSPDPQFSVSVAVPKFFSGPKGSHELRQPYGSLNYVWANHVWTGRLRPYYDDGRYIYAYEESYPEYLWAFSKNPNCGCNYDVWFRPGRETDGRWIVFHTAVATSLPINVVVPSRN